MRPFPIILALTLALSQGTPAAVTPTAAKKKSSTKKPAPKGSASKAGTRGRTTTAASRSRKSSPPRQQTPTSDRYQEIQQALATKGYYKGEPTGSWGPDSVDALKRFQADQKLQVDGKIGALSLIALGLGPKHESSGDAAVIHPPAAQGKP